MSSSNGARAQIRLLRGSAAAQARPVIAFFPGGPGLSSHTLTGIERLTRTFDVALVDPPGTAGLPEDTKPVFDDIVDALCTALSKTKRPLVIAGHSFGGYYALRCLSRGSLPIRGLALMSTPLTPATYEEASRQYDHLKDPGIIAAGRRWEANPSEETFRDWVANCSSMFFGNAARENGRRMLLDDRMSFRSGKNLMALMSNAQLSGELIASARAYQGPKVFIAGENDALYPLRCLKSDAAQIPMDFHPIAGSGHFPAFENPEAVAHVFEMTFGVQKTQGVS